MTIYTDGLREMPAVAIHELPSSTGEYLGATAGEDVENLPLVGLYRIDELGQAQRGDQTLETALGRVQAGADPADVLYGPRPATGDVPTEEARARVKQAGLDKALHLPEAPSIKAAALDIMMERARARQERQATIARGPGGIVAGALGVGTSLLVSAIDPINVAAAFIPVVGEARYAKIMADAGAGLLARAGARAGVGAASGAVGMAAIEPIEYYARTQEGQDYRFTDALRSVMYGALLGGVLHSGGGAVADVLRSRAGKPLYPFAEGEAFAGRNGATGGRVAQPQAEIGLEGRVAALPDSGGLGAGEGRLPEPAGTRAGLAASPAEVLADLPPRAKEDVLRASIAALHDGEPVRAGELLAAGARRDGRIAESFNGAPPERPPQSLLQFIASRGGISDKDPLVADVLQSFGGKNRGVPGAGMLVTSKGKSLDRLREAAVEAGYLHDAGRASGGVSESTINDLLAAIDAEARGQKQYPAGAEGFQSKAELAALAERDQVARESYRAGTEAEFDRLLDGYGVTSIRPALKMRATIVMEREGVRDPAVAIERALEYFDMRPERAVPGRGLDEWQRFADDPAVRDDAAAFDALRAVEHLPEPESLSAEPSKRVQAAEKAAAEAEADYKANEPYIPDEIKAKVEHQLKALDVEAADRAEVIKRGAACLAAAVGSVT